jgi:hypothetical protein
LIFNRAVPNESQIFKRALNLIGTAGPHACAVEILDPQEPAAALLACVEITAERRNQ